MPDSSSPRTKLLLVLCLALLLIRFEQARGLSLRILRFPFAVAAAAAKTVFFLPRLPSFLKEEKRLRETITRQQVELASLREIIRQSQQAELLLKRHAVTQAIAAAVIMRSILPTQQTALLGKGRRQGIVPEMVVLDAGGVVGRVIEVQQDTATVLLLMDPDSRVAGLIERSRETGLLIGKSRGRLELTYLDAEADVAEGDSVVTAGLGGIFPKGLLLGVVSRVARDEVSGVARVLVKPAANFTFLEDVLCVAPASLAYTGSP